mmetsp:Transcript_117409/g.207764  ORF Transcript_117409/g.207764 Transcript_117409/m.207764 type:complete len:163 (+) Transcript_117409:118-606(+)
MSIVTGGLGGLGMLAGRELSAAGHGYVISTSRTGRAGALRPELQTVLNTTEANSVHYSVKCDVSDGGAMIDMFAALSRRPVPEKYNHLDEIIADLKDKLRRRPIKRFLTSALEEMQGLKTQLDMIISEQKGAFEPEQAELFDYKASQLNDIIDELEKEIASR